MNQLLRIGQLIKSETASCNLQVVDCLGAGGQGEVYKVTSPHGDLALKWYYPEMATLEQEQALNLLTKRLPPNANFLWPIELIKNDICPGFGYTMPLRSKSYSSMIDLVKRHISPTLRTLCTAALNMTISFYELHSQGLCYHDISYGNIFLDPKTGNVLICDNDNISINRKKAASGVSGTPRFMAPEVVIGAAEPSTKTDLYSLSVLLFYMFIMHHPLDGQREASIHSLDIPAMKKLYGTEPIFIYDPLDNSNRPVPGYQDNALILWPIYPSFLQKLFIRAFTDGIRDPQNGRIQETEWRLAFIQLRDFIMYCGNCAAENYYDPEKIKQGNEIICWSCKKVVQIPYRIRLSDNIIMLNHDTKLYPHHVDPQRRFNFEQAIAEVVQHPRNKNLWGIKNLSSDKWVVRLNDASLKDVEFGESVSLSPGIKIHFGKLQGEIRA